MIRIVSDSIQTRRNNLIAALLSPVFLGMAPVLGKLALKGGADPFTVAAVRTTLAASVLWIIYFIFWRKYIYIYPAGFLGCAVVGLVSGAALYGLTLWVVKTSRRRRAARRMRFEAGGAKKIARLSGNATTTRIRQSA